MAANNPHYDADPRAIQDDAKGRRFKPRSLGIVWGNDTRYWRIPDQGDGPAELLQVCWLEVTGSMDVQTMAGKKIEIGFNVSLRSDAFGWSGCPVYLMAKVGKKGRYIWRKINLLEVNGKDDIPQTKFVMDIPQPFTDDPNLYFGLYEVWSGKWKGGLQIHYAFVREAK